MSIRRLLFILSVIVFITVSVLLTTGSKWLLISLSKTSNIPSGTFITWLGLIALPSLILLGTNKLYFPKSSIDKLFRKFILFALLLAILWVPVSYFLAGNISFTFSEKDTFQGGQKAMQWFWYFTYGIPIYSLSIILIYGIISLFKTRN